MCAPFIANSSATADTAVAKSVSQRSFWDVLQHDHKRSSDLHEWPTSHIGPPVRLDVNLCRCHVITPRKRQVIQARSINCNICKQKQRAKLLEPGGKTNGAMLVRPPTTFTHALPLNRASTTRIR